MINEKRKGILDMRSHKFTWQFRLRFTWLILKLAKLASVLLLFIAIIIADVEARRK